jgi:hypothetical protein
VHAFRFICTYYWSRQREGREEPPTRYGEQVGRRESSVLESLRGGRPSRSVLSMPDGCLLVVFMCTFVRVETG